MFLEKKKGEPPVLKRECFVAGSEDQTGEEFFRALTYLREQLVRMTQRQERTRYQKTALSFWVRCKAALNLSQVRVVYALRVAVLLALLSLGVKGIYLGPTLPAFLSPNVLQYLVDTFDLRLISSAEDDIKNCLKQNI